MAMATGMTTAMVTITSLKSIKTKKKVRKLMKLVVVIRRNLIPTLVRSHNVVEKKIGRKQ